MILVALDTCVLNREYVIINYTYIIENSLMKPGLCCKSGPHIKHPPHDLNSNWT